MTVALWIIAVCEVIRMAQNVVQIHYIHKDTGARDDAYAEFVKSLKKSDRECVEEWLKECMANYDSDKDESGEDA